MLEDAGDVSVELPAFFVAQELPAAFRAEHEMDDDVGEGLGHGGSALTGLGIVVGPTYPALQAGLSHCGPSALFDAACLE